MNREEIILNLNNKKVWFNDYYTIHEQKYNRLIALKINVEENTQLLQELYVQAEQVRAEIQALEAQLKDSENK